MLASRPQPAASPNRLVRLGLASWHRPKPVLIAAVLFVVVAGSIGAGAIKGLSIGGFVDSSSPSAQAERTLAHQFGVDVPGIELLVSTKAGVDAPAVASAGRRLAARLAKERGVSEVISYWSAGPAERLALRGRDGRTALIMARVAGSDDVVAKRVGDFAPHYRGRQGPLTVGVAGVGELANATVTQVTGDLTKAEMIAMPLVLLALVIIFRGAVAASLPLAIGVIAIVGTLFVLRILSAITPVSVFATNVSTGLGLGLAIDYSLFMVSRYRDELAAGRAPRDALATTMRTAGRTVAFSAAAVATSLAGLIVFPMYYLSSFAYAGVAVTAIAALGALAVLPALLSVLGPRIDALSLSRRKRSSEGGSGRFWAGFSRFAMRWPLPIVTAGIGLLIVLGTPFLHAKLGFSDDRNLPRSVPVREVSDQIRSDFALRPDGTVFVLGEHAGQVTRPGVARELSAYALSLSRTPGVKAVQTATGLFTQGVHIAIDPGRTAAAYARGDSLWLAVSSAVDPYSIAGENLARAVRAVKAPFGVVVTGIGAQVADTAGEMSARMPIALAFVVIATFAVLLLLTGSLLAPIKALVLNALSLTAVFGALVFVFQDGHMQWLVGSFTVTGSINMLNPPLMFCIAFGLSMDYEVFMLSRIREEHDCGRENRDAVSRGLQRVGPLITAAAALMAIVFTSFATSSVTNVKAIGVGMALAVVIDATVVRAALVPAIMRLAGRFNWWAPAPVRRARERLVSDRVALADSPT
jgi:RND superfamily putative drug exporter